MPLTYDARTIENKPTEATQTLTFLSLITGIPEITKANASEVFTRIRIYKMAVSLSEELEITFKDVLDNIGLKTNTEEKSKAKFHGHIIRIMRERVAGNG